MEQTVTTKTGILMAEAQHIGYGQRRKTLEDRCTSRLVRTAGGLSINIGIVADGIGGASAGETAGQLTVDTILQYLQNSRETNINLILRNAVALAHQMVRKSAERNVNLRSMGTTVSIAAIHQNKLYAAHVGDSRIYLVRGENIKQLTMDHTWGNERVRSGQFKLEEVQNHSRRDELARYIGAPIDLEVDIGVRMDNLHPRTSVLYNEGYPLQAGDVVLLCSDGLIKERRGVGGHYAEEAEIVNVIQRNIPQDAANTLVSLALGRQVDDNVSVVIMEMPGKKKKIGLPVGVSPFVIALGAGIIGLFILVGIILTLLLLPTPLGFKNTPSAAVAVTTATALPGYVFVTADQGVGQYYTPGQNPERLVNGEYAPIQAGTRINVVAGVIHLGFPDGSVVYIGENSVVYINQMADTNTGVTENQLMLETGSILVRITGGGSTRVLNQSGYSSVVSGSLMGIEVDGAQFWVDCFEGHCLVYNAEKQVLGDLTGPTYGLVEDGSLVENTEQVVERIRKWVELIGTENFTQFGVLGTPTPDLPTPTQPPTPDAQATNQAVQATRECEDLQTLNTPCPPP